MEGTLLKKTKGGKFLPRHFHLKGTTLSWLKSDKKTPLSVDISSRDVEIIDVKFGTRKFLMQVVTPERTLVLAASGQGEKSEWMAALERATGKKKQQIEGRKSVKRGKVDARKVAGIASVLGLGPGGGGMKSQQATDKLKKKLAASGGMALQFNAPAKCMSCGKTVYATERIQIDKLIIHKTCFKCEHCNRQLGMNNFAAVSGKLYCKAHYMELFKRDGGSYDFASDASDVGQTEEDVESKIDHRQSRMFVPDSNEVVVEAQGTAKEEVIMSPEEEDPQDTGTYEPPPAPVKLEFAEEAARTRRMSLNPEALKHLGVASLEEKVIENTPEEADEPEFTSTGDRKLSHAAVVKRPTIAANRRRAPTRKAVGQLLPQIEVDRKTHEFTFTLKTGGSAGITLICHASSYIEKRNWTRTLSNACAALRLQNKLEEAQKVDMMSALQAQMNLENFVESHETSYQGYLEKLSIKSQRNWKRRFFELGETGDGMTLSYFSDENARKPLHVIKLTWLSTVWDVDGDEIRVEEEKEEMQEEGPGDNDSVPSRVVNFESDAESAASSAAQAIATGHSKDLPRPMSMGDWDNPELGRDGIKSVEFENPIHARMVEVDASVPTPAREHKLRNAPQGVPLDGYKKKKSMCVVV